AVEPFDNRTLKSAFRHHHDVSALALVLGGVNRRGIVHRNDLERLHALVALTNKAYHAGTCQCRLVTIPPAPRNVQQNISGSTIIRINQITYLVYIVPLFCTVHLKKISRFFFVALHRSLYSNCKPFIVRRYILHALAVTHLQRNESVVKRYHMYLLG